MNAGGTSSRRLGGSFPSEGSLSPSGREGDAMPKGGEKQLQLERRLEEKEAEMAELLHKLNVTEMSASSHRTVAEEEHRIREQLSEENKELKRLLVKNHEETRVMAPQSSPQGGPAQSDAAVVKLKRQLEEADRAKAHAEEEAEDLRAQLAQRVGELHSLRELLSAEEAARSAMASRTTGYEVLELELETRSRQEQMMQQQVHDLKRSLVEVKQECARLEDAMRERAQQQRAETRSHQAALLQKNNEIGALRQQLAERSQTGGRVLKMSIDMMVLRHAKEKLEEEVQARDQELETLRARLASSGADLGTVAVAASPSQGVEGVEGEGAQTHKRRSSLEELQSAYGEQVKALEKELESLRVELAKSQGELGFRSQEAVLQKSALEEELQAVRRELQESQQQLQEQRQRGEDMLREQRRDEGGGLPHFSSFDVQPSVDDLQEEISMKDRQVQKLTNEVIELKKRMKLGSDQPGSASQRLQLLERDVAALEGERVALQQQVAETQRHAGELEQEVGQLSGALALAQSQRGEMEQILQQTEEELNKYYEETRRSIQKHWNDLQQCRVDLQRATDREVSMKNSLTEVQRATQQRMTNLHKAKKAAAKEVAEKAEQVETLRGQLGALSRELEERQEAEAELTMHLANLQRQQAEGGPSRVMVEGMRADLGRVRQDLQKVQDALDQEHMRRLEAEDAVERSQAEVEYLRGRVNNSFQEEREQLTRAISARNETLLDLDKKEQECLKLSRELQKLHEYRQILDSISVPDRRRSGHKLVLRPKTNFNCRACKCVKHGFMWRCQDPNCSDLFCIECMANTK